jgi:hypothetical protein
MRICKLAAGLAALSFCALLWAQTPTGSIEARSLTHGSGNPGASVVVTENGTDRIARELHDRGTYEAMIEGAILSAGLNRLLTR